MKTLSDSEIIDALGGTAAVARLCRVKQPSVSGWRVMGIPNARRQFLELLRPDIFGPAPAALSSFPVHSVLEGYAPIEACAQAGGVG